MERPKLSGVQGTYIEHLETLLSRYESKKTIVNSYFGLKKVVEDLNNIMINGIDVPLELGGVKRVDVVSYDSLSSKDDKIMDRLFKFIDAIPKYNASLKSMEETFAPEIKSEEKDFGTALERMLLKEKDVK